MADKTSQRTAMAVSEIVYVIGWLQGFASQQPAHTEGLLRQAKRLEEAIEWLKEVK